MTSELYTKLATADSPALVIYLLDISKSMGAPMEKGSSRLEVVMGALKLTITEMVQRSLRQGKIRPRYRVGMIAYSTELWDILDGIKSVDLITGIPKLHPQQRTNPAAGLKKVKKMLLEDISQWSSEAREACPAPLVVHMTDGELNEISDDPEGVAQEIKAIKVPDGNVLLQNIFVTDDIKLPVQDVKSWPGYQPGQDTGNAYGNKLLAMSSILPEPYVKLINGHQNMHLQPGSAMMFPGTTLQFVREAFVANGVSSIIGDKRASTKRDWDEN
jgi:hypothetical protein